MSVPAKAEARRVRPAHIHLPSVHVRSHDDTGFDYEEDLYVTGAGRHRRVERVIRLVAIERGRIVLERETRDVLCDEELAELEEILPILMDEENPATQPAMEEVGRREYARQFRIAQGQEIACLVCGCSETRACSGGCCWATATLCSRCVL